MTKLQIGLYLENQTFLVYGRRSKKCSTLNFLSEKQNCVTLRRKIFFFDIVSVPKMLQEMAEK